MNTISILGKVKDNLNESNLKETGLEEILSFQIYDSKTNIVYNILAKNKMATDIFQEIKKDDIILITGQYAIAVSKNGNEKPIIIIEKYVLFTEEVNDYKIPGDLYTSNNELKNYALMEAVDLLENKIKVCLKFIGEYDENLKVKLENLNTLEDMENFNYDLSDKVVEKEEIGSKFIEVEEGGLPETFVEIKKKIINKKVKIDKRFINNDIQERYYGLADNISKNIQLKEEDVEFIKNVNSYLEIDISYDEV